MATTKRTFPRFGVTKFKNGQCLVQNIYPVGGLAYGKNITSTSNTKETQPHWYIGKFSELLDAVMVS